MLAAERPQLVVTNLMVASAMLNRLWAVTEQGSVPYSEVYLDVVHNAGPQPQLVPRPGLRAADEVSPTCGPPGHGRRDEAPQGVIGEGLGMSAATRRGRSEAAVEVG